MKNKKILIILAMSACRLLSAASENVDSVVPHMLGEVVVTGTASAKGVSLLPYTVTTVGREVLDNSASPNVLEIISGDVPGLFVTQRGILGFGVSNGGSGHIKIRGVGGDRASAVLMMVDGQPQFAGIYSHHVADMYNKEYVERVEVLRGPGSVLYGSNAMAGVINIITRNSAEDGFHASLMSQYGSYNTWMTSVDGSARYGRFSSLVSLSYDRTDGNIDGMDFKQYAAYAKATYEICNSWKTMADYTFSAFSGDDPVYPTLSDPSSTAVYHQHVIRGEASLAAFNQYESTDGCLRIYYSYGNHYIDDPRHFHSLDDRLGAMAYQNFKPWGEADVTVGFDFDRYTGKIPMSGGVTHSPGALSTLDRKHITEYSPYLTYTQGLFDRFVVLSAGMRAALSDKFGSHVIPQGGLVVNPGAGFTFKASAAMGYRNPSFRELYLYKMANSLLEPERMMNYDVSLSKYFSRYMKVNVTLYYSKGDNMIQVVDQKNVNTGRFINKGIEAEMTSAPVDGLNLRATYSYLHSSLDNLTGAPRHQYFLGATYTPVKFLTTGISMKGVGKLFVSDGIKDQSYATLDIRLNFHITRYLDLSVNLNNVTDARYMINRGYPMPGFNAMGGFKLKI